MANTTFVGNIGEDSAVQYLEEKGYNILERNAKICGSEIDIICEVYTARDGTIIKQYKHKEPFRKLFSGFKASNSSNSQIKDVTRTLVFCEVKTRSDTSFGSGAEAVTKYKVGRYVTAAKAYMTSSKFKDVNVRFDIIEICGKDVNHIENAFDTNDAKYSRRKY